MDKRRRKLPIKLLSIVLTISSLMTVLITAFQLYWDYSANVSKVRGNIDLVEKNYLNGLATAIWNLDEPQVNLYVTGIENLEGIVYLKLEGVGIQPVEVGSKVGGDIIEDTFEVIYNGSETPDKVGKIQVAADIEPILDEIKDRALLVLLSQFIKTTIVSILVLLIFQRLVTRHLVSISEYMREFTTGTEIKPITLNRTFEPGNKVRDELDVVAESMNIMFTELTDSHDLLRSQLDRTLEAETRLAQLNADLEKEVENRVATIMVQQETITKQNRHLEAIMAVIPFGIFAINQDFAMIDLYSTHLVDIIGKDNSLFTGGNFVDSVLSNSNLSSEQKNIINDTLFTCMGSEVFNWTLNSHLIPKEFELETPNEKPKFIEMYLEPIADDSGMITKFLVSLIDVTDQRALVEKFEQKQKDITIINELVNNNGQNLNVFLRNLKTNITNCQNIIDNTALNIVDRKNQVLGIVHTIKGNSRIYGFACLSEQCHATESAITEIPDIEQEDLARSFSPLAEFSATYEKYLHVIVQDSINMDTFNEFRDKSKEIMMSESHSKHREVYTLVLELFRNIDSKQTTSLDKIISYSQTIAKEYGLAVPRFHVKSDIEEFLKFDEITISGMLMLLLKNSFAHGIEPPEERDRRNKHARGNIYIEYRVENNFYVIDFWDDGRGADLVKLGFEEESPSFIQIKAVLLEAGKSSHEGVDQHAGRGIGLNALFNQLMGMGGSFDIKPGSITATSGFWPLKFEIRIPVERLTYESNPEDHDQVA